MKCSDEKCGGMINPRTNICISCGLMHNVQGDEVHKAAIPIRNAKGERTFLGKDNKVVYKK
ncbi:MAG: hypothetical protein WCX17_04700 [Parcubacteria group bacterium]|jgi:hypothetical protein